MNSEILRDLLRRLELKLRQPFHELKPRPPPRFNVARQLRGDASDLQ